MITYLILVYIWLTIIFFVGAVNESFDGNSWQRLGLGLGALWTVWRIYLLNIGTWGYPHEPLIATGMAVYAYGTMRKTQSWCKRRNKAAAYLRGKISRDEFIGGDNE